MNFHDGRDNLRTRDWRTAGARLPAGRYSLSLPHEHQARPSRPVASDCGHERPQHGRQDRALRSETGSPARSSHQRAPRRAGSLVRLGLHSRWLWMPREAARLSAPLRTYSTEKALLGHPRRSLFCSTARQASAISRRQSAGTGSLARTRDWCRAASRQLCPPSLISEAGQPPAAVGRGMCSFRAWARGPPVAPARSMFQRVDPAKSRPIWCSCRPLVGSMSAGRSERQGGRLGRLPGAYGVPCRSRSSSSSMLRMYSV